MPNFILCNKSLFKIQKDLVINNNGYCIETKPLCTLYGLHVRLRLRQWQIQNILIRLQCINLKIYVYVCVLFSYLIFWILIGRCTVINTFYNCIISKCKTKNYKTYEILITYVIFNQTILLYRELRWSEL